MLKMPAVEHNTPEQHLRHSHSASLGGAIVPMWDSSDPERAPPPLPLNPQSPVGHSPIPHPRSGPSLAIQSAHAALQEKARENALVPHLAKRMTDTSPERGIRGQSPHKRMQSLQPGTVRDMSLMIEGKGSAHSTPKGSPEKERHGRPSTPNRPKDYERDPRSTEKENAAPGTPTPMPASLTPVVRPAVRRAPHSILGESTPPQSATMLALHNMTSTSSRESEPPLANVTNSSAAMKSSPYQEQLSNQLITLTNIATALQKEMSQLSRRSRDNATDLMSLKEATHARDEDIRKSLRELVSNASHSRHHHDTHTGGLYLDNKAFNTSPTQKNARPFSLPRIPSPNSFAASIDRESNLSTPSLIGDSPATFALLEKIIRDMGTKDGQESVITRLSELADKLAGMASSAKVEELIGHLKASRQQLMLPAPGGGGGGGGSDRPRNHSFGSDESSQPREIDWSPHNGVVAHRVEKFIHDKEGRRMSATQSRTGDVLNDDIIKLIKSVKDSVAQGGGLTAEVKALVRELRGEVLGMGRELARKLDESHGKTQAKSESSSRAELAKIVEESLEQIKVYMHQRLREHRRDSSDDVKIAIDYQEIYNAMRNALSDSQIGKREEPDLKRDDVMEAVKEAWENYKPEIEIQQLGLERDEVLECLKEGLKEYAPRNDTPRGATQEEVIKAITDALKHYVPPQVETPPGLSRDEVLDAFRECLEEFEFPIAPSTGQELTRDDMVDAVKEGLNSFEFPNTNTALVPHGGDNNANLSSEVVGRLHDIMQYMREEFKAISNEAKENVASSEKDTEHVLDATKEGFETLRAHMEEYVDKVAGDSTQEELLANLTTSFNNFREEISGLVSKASDGSRDMLKQEIESLRDTVNSSLVPHVPPASDHREVLEAIRESLERMRCELHRPHAGTTDILDALHEGFSDLRCGIERMSNKPVDLTANDEILDALKTGLDDVRANIDSLREGDQNDRAIAPLGAIPSDALVPADLAKHDDIKNLEVVLSQLRVKMEAIEAAEPTPPAGGLSKDDLAEMEEMIRNGASKEDLNEMGALIRNAVSKDDLNEMEELIRKGISKEDLNIVEEMLQKAASKEDFNKVEEMLKNMQDSIAFRPRKEGEPPINPEDGATKEDVIAIETILRNTKAQIDDLVEGEQAVRKDHIDAIEALILEAKESLGSVSTQLETMTRKEDLVRIESIVTQVTASLDEVKERADKALEDPEKVTKTDVDAVEAAVLDLKSVFDQVVKSEIAALPSKDDLKTIEDIVRELKEGIETETENHSKAIVERQTENVGISERIAEMRAFLQEFQGTVKSDIATASSKDDFKNLEDLVKEIKDSISMEAENNSKAIVERHTENVGISERVTEVTTFLHEFQGMVKEKLDAGGNGIEALSKLLEGLGETVGQNANVGSDVKEMFELMKSEFEDSKATLAGAKLDTDEKFNETTEVLAAKLDEKIGELVTKYEEFQLVIEDRAKAGEARDEKMEAEMVGNKAIAEELKVLVDTLGSTVTDSLEKMEEASKTVFEKVEILYGKSEDNHADGKMEHQMTRDQVKEAMSLFEGLQGRVSEFQPKLLESVKDILLVVGQHYEYSKNSVTDLQKYIEDSKPELPLLPPPVEKYDDAVVQSKLDKIENEVHYKLDRLVEHTQTANKAYAQLDTLDQVHQKVVQTAADISEFLSSQKQRIEDEHQDREKTLQETTIALERQKAEKEQVEANLVHLRDEEAQLRESVLALRAEQELLTRQKTRLTADVSSLETALHLRREELHAMDVRAEGLERRILEGVLDHSRALLMTKSGAKGRDAMSRKRVSAVRSSLGPIDAPNGSVKPKSRNAVNMAVAGNRASLLPPNAAANGTNRRILSLSQINNNVHTAGLKRSQSVRTAATNPNAGAPRKSSWAPSERPGSRKGYGELDKENVGVVPESEEEGEEEEERGEEATSYHHHHGEEAEEEGADDAATLRCSSHDTTVTNEAAAAGDGDVDDHHALDDSDHAAAAAISAGEGETVE
ncbi:hypothetical protein F4809DRAFT_507664 [Biscogniauxia mediterranea]|nr:hypothetical protein F4809DRAFT_507664 [Biscogniauxia mediterranea]